MKRCIFPLPLLLLSFSCAEPAAQDRGPIGAADSLGSCAVFGACGGQSDGNCFCDEMCSEIGDCCSDYEEICLEDETVSFVVDGYVTGDSTSNRAPAETSWAQACDQWTQDLQNKFGAATATSCGDSENIVSIGFMFASRPSATLTVTLPATATIIESRTGRSAFGESTSNLEPALKSWAAACNDEISKWQQVYGARLLAASCPEPTNIVSIGRFFESDVQLWVAPLKGTHVSGTDYVVGARESNLEPAIRTWSDACSNGIRGSMELAAGALEVAECEARVNLVSVGRLFTSEVTVTLVGDEPIASSPPPVIGEVNSNLEPALASWRAICDSELAAIRTRDGERLIGGVCGVPSNTAAVGFRFESQPTIWHEQ